MSAALPEFVDSLVLDGTKVGWYPDRIAAWHRGEKVAPITIDCAMTRKCQAACHFCYAQLQSSESDEQITQIKFMEFLSDAAELGVKGVSFISDGESTVVPWYANAVEHAAGVGLAVGAGSNGIKLTRPVLERILPHLSYLRFNFSAGERKRYAEIMGVPQHCYDDVIQNIKDGMEIINRDSLPCTLNMQMVSDPRDSDQIIPFANLAAQLRPVYAIVKHCSDSVEGSLGVDYEKYDDQFKNLLVRAEEIGRFNGVRITAKWNKIESKLARNYDRCFGAPFIMQMSGNGLVAPCGMLFNERFKAFHIGNISKQRFKDIWASDRYKEVFDYLAGDNFDPRVRCGAGCLQHNTNDYLFKLVNGKVSLPTTAAPPQLQFI
jgi:MoaA/NifB/PqqE/SkfB family radical SAM enzyme